MEKGITANQLKKIHVLISQLGLIDMKVDFIYKVSGGRVVSSKELTTLEAKHLIEHLSKFDGSDKMRKKIIALAYEAGIIYGDSEADRKMNYAKLDKFLRERGAVKKPLNNLTKAELVKVVNQFEQIIRHYSQTKLNRDTKTMLASIGITTTGKAPLNQINNY